MSYISLLSVYQEVNVPRHASRYSNLVSVELSEESFTKMTSKQVKKRSKTTKATSSEIEAPSIMELYP